jgi:hypothetical protein
MLPAAPVFGSAAPNTTRATRAWNMAPMHVAHGSSVMYKMLPGKRYFPKRQAASCSA